MFKSDVSVGVRCASNVRCIFLEKLMDPRKRNEFCRILWNELPQWLHGNDPLERIKQPCLTREILHYIAEGLSAIRECDYEISESLDVALRYEYDIDQNDSGDVDGHENPHSAVGSVELILDTFDLINSGDPISNLPSEWLICMYKELSDGISNRFVQAACCPSDDRLYNFVCIIGRSDLIDWLNGILKLMREEYEHATFVRKTLRKEAFHVEPCECIRSLRRCIRRLQRAAKKIVVCLRDLLNRSHYCLSENESSPTRKRLREE
jgi:hypothetical protein